MCFFTNSRLSPRPRPRCAGMTIDSGWVKLLKQNAPKAFTDALPAKPDVVFIDGQIKLMKGEHVTTWEAFLRGQFVNTIEHGFSLGARTVVLGFDDYKHVPRSKNMTQSKRNRSVPTVTFDETQALPARPPEDWAAAMRNRTFKIKVITFVVNSLKHHYSGEERKSVVLDFSGKPLVVCGDYKLPAMFDTYTEDGAGFQRGECDIKAPNWIPKSGTLLLISTDGDFIPIALIQLEKRLQEQGEAGNILIHRIKTKVKETCKRPRLGSQKREYEYVNVQLLLGFLASEFPKTDTPARFFSCLVALTGCDFCMNLPAVGPTKLWAIRHTLGRNELQSSYDIMGALLQVYYIAFGQKARGVDKDLRLAVCDTSTARAAYAQLVVRVQNSAQVAQRTKESLWTSERLVAHVCNTMWTMQYWTQLHEYPDPLDGNFGYETRNNLVRFAAQPA